MSCETEYRATVAALGPEIVDGAEAQVFDRKSKRFEPLDHQLLATAIDGTDRGKRNQRLRQLQSARRSAHRRFTQIPQAPSATAHISTHPGIDKPSNRQVTLAHSPEPVNTFTSTSLREKILSM